MRAAAGKSRAEQASGSVVAVTTERRGTPRAQTRALGQARSSRVQARRLADADRRSRLQSTRADRVDLVNCHVRQRQGSPQANPHFPIGIWWLNQDYPLYGPPLWVIRRDL